MPFYSELSVKVLQRLTPTDSSVSKFGVTVQLMFPFDSCDHCVPIGWVTSVPLIPSLLHHGKLSLCVHQRVAELAHGHCWPDLLDPPLHYKGERPSDGALLFPPCLCGM